MALLSAFAEMGLKLRVDMPEQAMEIATVFFRQSTTANEAKVGGYHYCNLYPSSCINLEVWINCLVMTFL